MTSKKPPKPKKKSSGSSKTIRLYGRHAVFAALANPARDIKQLWVTEKLQHELPPEWQKSAHLVEGKALDKLVEEGAPHQGIVLETMPLPTESLSAANGAQCVLLLDHVTDPHNVGAIMRSAAAFGVDAIIYTKDHAPAETAVMAKAASGALELLPRVAVTNLSQAMKQLKKDEFWCIGLDGYAETLIGDMPSYDKVALVLGAEGKGLRDGVAAECDLLVKLPMSDAIESLNVSNAAAVALYAISAQ